MIINQPFDIVVSKSVVPMVENFSNDKAPETVENLLPVGSAANVPEPVCRAEQVSYFTATFRPRPRSAARSPIDSHQREVRRSSARYRQVLPRGPTPSSPLLAY